MSQLAIKDLEAKLERRDARITALEAELAAMRAGGEPVAWRATIGDIKFHGADREALLQALMINFKAVPETIEPLYTHPQPTTAQEVKDEPDMFWDADDNENFAHEIQDIVNEYDPGSIVTIECAKRLPNFRVIVTLDGDDLSYEHIDAAIAAQGEKS